MEIYAGWTFLGPVFFIYGLVERAAHDGNKKGRLVDTTIRTNNKAAKRGSVNK